MKRALIFILISLSLGLLADSYSINERISTQLFEVTTEISTNDILQKWNAPARDIDITSYRIHKDNQLLNESMKIQFSDHPEQSGTYSYYSKTVYGDHESSPSDTLSIDFTDLEPAKIPQVSKLTSSYPNPFNPQTTFSFSLHQEGSVILTIYDV